MESNLLVESDAANGRLRVVHDTQETLPAYFIATLLGQQRAATRTFLKWLGSQS